MKLFYELALVLNSLGITINFFMLAYTQDKIFGMLAFTCLIGVLGSLWHLDRINS